jgi:hypothetical protein
VEKLRDSSRSVVKSCAAEALRLVPVVKGFVVYVMEAFRLMLFDAGCDVIGEVFLVVSSSLLNDCKPNVRYTIRMRRNNQ